MNRRLAPGVTMVDLKYRGHPGYIASCVLDTGDGLAIVDPGPAVSLGALEKGLDLLGADIADVTRILLTHVHLDHAGGTGTLLRKNPAIQVFVHERGARHMVNPARLLESATRLYGDRMAELWGEVAPVPEAQITALAGGERLALGSRRVRVAFTPGHATHHVSFLDQESGLAFVGDAAGLLLAGGRFVMPVAPPPDTDLEAWRTSHETIRKWKPGRLFHTHFGPGDDPATHLQRHLGMLENWAERVRVSLEAEGTDAERAEAFRESVIADFIDEFGEDEAARLGFVGVRASWDGLARYLRGKQGAVSGEQGAVSSEQ
jgi:glyoxylase-like metal-dependent hydrolase (beta-lactamase superfamily II)